MAVSQTNQYKNARREIAKALTRQSMFIAEYVQFKYKDIYKEAGTMYNQLNQQYPCKPDLRKTTEFRDWKNTMAKADGENPDHIPREKKNRYIYKRTAYWNIALDHEQTNPSHTSDKIAETSETPKPANKVMCLNIPLLNASTYRSTQQTTAEEGDLQQVTVEEGDQPTNHQTGMDMAPLILTDMDIEEGDQPTNHQTDMDMDMTPSIFTDMDMASSILDGISQETMHKIIEELQADPDLKDIMNDIEEEIVGLEVDLPELYDPLQEESIFW